MAAWRKLSAVSSFLYRFPRKLIFSSKVIGQPLFVAVYQIIWCTSNQERLQVQGVSLLSTSSPTLLKARHSIFPRRNQMKNGSECCQIFHHYCTWLLELLPLQHKKLIAAQTIQALRKKTIPTKQQHRPPQQVVISAVQEASLSNLLGSFRETHSSVLMIKEGGDSCCGMQSESLIYRLPKRTNLCLRCALESPRQL